jgi:hypothetical protein
MVMTLRSIECFDVSSLGHIEIPMPYNAISKSGIVLTSLDGVGMMLGSVASAHPRDCVRRNLRRSSSSVILRGRFDEFSPH